MHYIWYEILLKYQLGWDIEYLEYLSIYIYIYIKKYIYIYIYICVYIYDLKLFQINVTFGWWCLLYTANLNQPLNQLKFINASYDTYCEKYLLKPKFMKLSNFAWFIDLFMTSFNQRYPLRYHISTFNRYCLIIQIISLIPFIYCTDCLYFHIWWVLLDNSDYQSHTIHIFCHFMLDLV